MLLYYTPDLGKPDEKREFTFKPDEMPSVEADAIERVTGWTWDELGEKFLMGSQKAMRAVLWVFLKRDDPALKFKDLDGLKTGQMSRDFDATELAAMKDNLDRKRDSMDEAQIEAIESMLEQYQFDRIAAAEAAAEADDPKASPSGSPKKPTGKPGPSTG
jgi:hypothetical protein